MESGKMHPLMIEKRRRSKGFGLKNSKNSSGKNLR
jgi:hypothetical protein